MSKVLSGRDLMRLREEYAAAVVEKMTAKEARAYLRQVIYNDVAVESGIGLAKKIRQVFGEEIYDHVIEDITTSKK